MIQLIHKLGAIASGRWARNEHMSETKRISFSGFTVAVPNAWEDTSADVDASDPPPTLSISDGVGALQFSVALYSGGARPYVSSTDLREMLVGFATTHELGPMAELILEDSRSLSLAAGSFRSGGDFVRVWYASSGGNFALATYVCELGYELEELSQCEAIVRSIQFFDSKARPN